MIISMGKGYMKIKFPCGFEYEERCELGFLTFGEYNFEMPKECPIHGKNCKKEKSNGRY